jgi:hypothetical protein
MLAFSKLPGSKRTPLVDRAIKAGVDFLFSKDPARADYPSGWAPKPSGNWWWLSVLRDQYPANSRRFRPWAMSRPSPSQRRQVIRGCRRPAISCGVRLPARPGRLRPQTAVKWALRASFIVRIE